MAYHLRESLALDDIFALAERESGAVDFDDDGLRSRVKAMVDWINERGPYTPDQVNAMSRQIQGVLARRLKIWLDRKRYPIAEEKIERPIFIIGFPRSGTTLIHSLLAEDPEALAPQSWQLFSPSPPPGAGLVAPERYAYAQRMVEAWMDFCPAQKPMHPYIDKGAFQMVEDEELASFDFRNNYCYQFYKVPTFSQYELFDDDRVANLRWHREYLQHFQWNTGKMRWICKGPGHQAYLKDIFEVYPDALCIWPHRPMGEIFASIVTLSATIFNSITNRPTDLKANGRNHAQLFKDGFDHVLSNELIDDPRVMHVPFRDITSDPVGLVHRICDRQGVSFSDEFETRVKAWLAAPENQVDRYGRYPYSYEALGIEREWVDELFADYSKRFGLD